MHLPHVNRNNISSEAIGDGPASVFITDGEDIKHPLPGCRSQLPRVKLYSITGGGGHHFRREIPKSTLPPVGGSLVAYQAYFSGAYSLCSQQANPLTQHTRRQT